MDYLTTLPVDLIFQLLTYLPFDDVINVCQLNHKLHSCGINYNIKWKALINNTYKNLYEDKLNTIRSKLNIDGYNYLVYTQLINLLDHLTQLMIYYRQCDMKSFNDEKFDAEEHFLTMFFLNKPEEEMKKYNYYNEKSYFELLKGETPSINKLNSMLCTMAGIGNVSGVKYLIEKGANIHTDKDWGLKLLTIYHEHIVTIDDVLR